MTQLLSEIQAADPAKAIAYRLEEVAAHERQSLLVNAALVIVSLAAIATVVSTSARERKLAAALKRRVEEETAMAGLARSLSEAVTLDDSAARILYGTTAILEAVGAYLEIASPDSGFLEFSVLTGGDSEVQRRVYEALPPVMAGSPPGKPELMYELRAMERWLPQSATPECVHCSALVVPLLASGEQIGVLALLRDARAPYFSENERRQLRLIGDLAIAVLRRIHVERKAFLEMQQRAASELALREAAEALAGAFSVEDVSRQIAQSALEATHARGAFVEIVTTGHDGSPMLVVRGAVGADVPIAGATRAYAGSLSERAIDQQAPAIVTDMEKEYPSSATLPAIGKPGHAMILPIKDASGPAGVLFIVGIPRAEFRPQDSAWARTVAHLAALAYEKVRLLDETRERGEELERLMKSRQRLMRGFSHDVKNPLGAADGYADLLSAGIYGDLKDEQKESIQRIRRSIRRALDLIDDLHELARAETGTLSIRNEFVDVVDLVERSGDEYRGAAHAAGLPLTIEVADDIPVVETDAARVSQVVSNLISNAIKYTKSGSIKLRVCKYPSRAVRNIASWIDIEVADTGIGIPADKHEQIFEEFSRLNTTDRPGAGLGLAISKRLAEALGGQIILTSEIGRGSTFTFRIPVTPPESPGTPVVPPSTIATATSMVKELCH
ncbi:MAG TPA: ATP-binding protein [Gemmatimonadaceae bacterium]